ncbi:hypothetical protein [Haloarcula onubensis]|uniref:Uncharacterized protein n=1 Tax=Haloarcula onubensis TaxID=2950539 RepID=A0ABU2FQL6_9EURY|nr:hypothetical protein [Halomicroarcula sp. S3CR25-11]MDS0282694.1 hypothetical protein [Halomicroarcula sp. S3CR25-11]
MEESPDPPTPPVDLPDEIVSVLQDASVHDLRETVLYAQELLRHQHVPPQEIEPLPGEEIVEVTEHDDHLTVVKRQPCSEGCADCPHGPYVYEVTREHRPSGETHLHWAFIGRKIGDE